MNTAYTSSSVKLTLIFISLAVLLVSSAKYLYPFSPPQAHDSREPPTLSASELQFDGRRAYDHILSQVALGPRPTGSAAGQATGDFIITQLEEAGWQIEIQPFIFKGIPGRNIIGKFGRGSIILLGAHYDTRPAADHDPDPAQRQRWIVGANDGASGVAVLLELARILPKEELNHEIWLAFFDAEDQGQLAGWPFSVGSRTMADNLTRFPELVVIVDMVGDADQEIFYERFSTAWLQQEIWAAAAELGYESHFSQQIRHRIVDDHLPFRERGIPAIDIIDFDYPYWHTTADTADKVAPQSLQRVGRTLEGWLKAVPRK